MNLTLKVWRQKNKNDRVVLKHISVKNISSEMSFLEMFDVLNEQLIHEGKDPIAFDHDCREGICGAAPCISMAVRMDHGMQTLPASFT